MHEFSNSYMIEQYVKKLIENVPEESKNCGKIDLVLDSGVFNGSYLVGALHFLKEMENRAYIKVDRISGSSIGSIVGLCYIIDHLEIMPLLYKEFLEKFKQNYDLSYIKNIKTIFEPYIDDKFLPKINGKMYITYTNIKTGKKCVKNNFKSVDELFDVLLRSCFFPYFIDGNLCYKNKYLDGFHPYIFKKSENKRVLCLNLFGLDKALHAFRVKNENTNYNRILAGLLDIHNFFIRQSSTDMCSYVSEWSMMDNCYHNIRTYIEQFIVYVVMFIIYMQKYVTKDIRESIFYKIIEKNIQSTVIVILETYCL